MLRTFRLILLMLLGVFLGLILLDSDDGSSIGVPEWLLINVLIGAIAGLILEVIIRARSGEPESPPWRFNTRELLAALAVAAIGLGIAVVLGRL